jgi:hypothetical protein
VYRLQQPDHSKQIQSVRTGSDGVLTPEELADVQIKEQEKQRVFGVIPNFYVSYDANPASSHGETQV